MEVLHHDESGVVGRKLAAQAARVGAGAEGGGAADVDAAGDPYNLRDRFCKTYKQDFAKALGEIKAGKKRSCWSWYIFPTAPYVECGYEEGSYTNKFYALRDKAPNHLRGDSAARAFLRFEADGVNLRDCYLEMMTAVAEQLEGGVDSEALVGRLDDPKLRSSVRLFERMSRGGFDDEVNRATARCLALMGESPEPSEVGAGDSDGGASSGGGGGSV